MKLKNQKSLRVDAHFEEFIQHEVLPGTGISHDVFWTALAELFDEFAPRNQALLNRRKELQDQINAWHRQHKGQTADQGEYLSFLKEIGYLVDDAGNVQIDPKDGDPEIGEIAGPQLVVPSTNPRFALNAANARWGSLYDALYSTDAIGPPPAPGALDTTRAREVIAWVKGFLDDALPLAGASHKDVKRYHMKAGALLATIDGVDVPLASPEQFLGLNGHPDTPEMLVLRNHGLHILLILDHDAPVGSLDQAGLADVRIEAALSAIIDCEDSVAAVDAEDKITCYRTWLGLMRGDLCERFEKGGKLVTRRLAEDITYVSTAGDTNTLKGRALLFVRNVGHLMANPAVQNADGQDIPEGILDALCTVTIALHDWRERRANSPAGSIYVVKPKMHGPEEVGFADALFSAVERKLGLPEYTVKLGIMDEERRTSANLKACIGAARHRVAFINTGFLDRTGDEIHTSLEAGPMVRKQDMRSTSWLQAYEDRNVEIALACGFQGKAQIGKGMWAAPDQMHDMLNSKIAHPLSGANCGWVPSPTAATLHAMHYHHVNVAQKQAEIAASGRQTPLAPLLEIPLARGENWSEDEIAAEVDNNVQGILGYVVRWVDQGIGCSKVPDINDIGQMEDRATCRISAQHLANWLHHGVINPEQVQASLHRMALLVDSQNAGDSAYMPMENGSDSLAFAAASDLIFKGAEQPSGYTEPLLHAYRLRVKDGACERRRAG